MNNIIKVVNAINSTSLLSSVKGAILYQLIIESLENNEKIILDFSDYEFLSSTFLNSTFGKLIIDKNWNKEQLFKNIEVRSLSEDDMDRLMLSVQNALFKNEIILTGQSIEDIYSSNLSY